MRDREDWSQQTLAEEAEMTQNAISRLENPFYGKATITTLKRIAAVFDVALVVRFVPFSRLVKWVTGTTFEDHGLSMESTVIPSFAQEDVATLGRVPIPISDFRQTCNVAAVTQTFSSGGVSNVGSIPEGHPGAGRGQC